MIVMWSCSRTWFSHNNGELCSFFQTVFLLLWSRMLPWLSCLAHHDAKVEYLSKWVMESSYYCWCSSKGTCCGSTRVIHDYFSYYYRLVIRLTMHVECGGGCEQVVARCMHADNDTHSSPLVAHLQSVLVLAHNSFPKYVISLNLKSNLQSDACIF
jgi:hypothetical protein